MPRMIRFKRNNKSKAVYNVDTSKISISWNELLYDLIFIIVLDKLSEIVVTAETLSVPFIIMVISVFVLMVGSWFRKVLRYNSLHILQIKSNIDVPKYKFITYLEMIFLLMLFYKLEYFTFKFYIMLIMVFVIFDFIELNILRHTVFNVNKYNCNEILKMFNTYWNICSTTLNVGHILERFGVLIILFLGELLREVFIVGSSELVVLLAAITIFNFFDNNVRIIEIIEEETAKYSIVDYRILSKYFKSTLIILLLTLLSISYTYHNNISPTLIVVIIIFNKLNQMYTIHNLSEQWKVAEEVFCFVYFIFTMVFTLFVNQSSFLTLIIIILFPTFELLKKKAYGDYKLF